MKRLILLLSMICVSFCGYSQNLQISGGNTYSVSLCDNGLVYAWGLNGAGQLGLNAVGGLNAPGAPRQVHYFHPVSGLITPFSARLVDAGSGSHAIAVGCDEFVYVWGENACQQAGQGVAIIAECECNGGPATGTGAAGPIRVKVDATVPAPYNIGGFLTNVKYVSGANNASFAILGPGPLEGRVLSWGENSFGQLGNSNNIDQSLPVFVLKEDGTPLTNIVAIEGGDRCTYALDAAGFVYSWGLNGGKELGRVPLGGPWTGISSSPCGPGAGAAADQSYTSRAGLVQKNNGTNGNGGPLTGIISISGGDTHALALASSGQVWSWGGDWGGGGVSGNGQLGQGAGYQTTDFASLVLAVGNTTTNTPPFLSNVVYIAAGQASSAAVLANGNVVTWGGNGFYNGCTPATDSRPSGILGTGIPVSTACAAPVGSGSPVLVLKPDGTPLTGIKRISDGDAWYFAQDASGNIQAWGYNANTELSSGTTSLSYATSVPGPGCVLGAPCPLKPSFGPDLEVCFGFSKLLDAGEFGNTYDYLWEYSPTGTAPWTPVFDPIVGAAGGNIYTATQGGFGFGYYRVTNDDSRGAGPGECGPCEIVGDTIRISLLPSPYTSTGCSQFTTSTFEITAPTNSKIKWYTNPVGGVALNPSDSNRVISVPYASTYTTFTSPPCDHGLWAEDVTINPYILRPAATLAGASAAIGCATGSNVEQGNRSPLLLEVSNNLTLDSVDFIYPSFGFNTTKNYTVKIYENNPNSGANSCAGCVGDKDGKGALVYTSPVHTVTRLSGNPQELITIPIDFDAIGSVTSPGKYWVEVDGDEVIYFNNGACGNPPLTPGTPYWISPEVDNSGKNILKGITSLHDDAAYIGKSHLLNISFSTGTTYTCSRIFVCAPPGTCITPVDLISFTAYRNGFKSILNWVTSSEQNSDYFIVEKSVDGINFSSIGKVKAAGNSESIINYGYTDNGIGAGTTYYRLAQYDLDGKVHYSDIKAVSREGIKNVSILPNPNNGSFTVVIDGLSGNTSSRLFLRNALSQVVYSGSESFEAIRSVDIQHLASGIYYLEVQTEAGNSISKIIKE